MSKDNVHEMLASRQAVYREPQEGLQLDGRLPTTVLAIYSTQCQYPPRQWHTTRRLRTLPRSSRRKLSGPMIKETVMTT